MKNTIANPNPDSAYAGILRGIENLTDISAGYLLHLTHEFHRIGITDSREIITILFNPEITPLYIFELIGNAKTIAQINEIRALADY
jgi:hypothetical protein